MHLIVEQYIMNKIYIKSLLLIPFLIGINACTSLTPEERAKTRPAILKPFVEEVAAERIWRYKMARAQENYSHIRMALDEQKIFAVDFKRNLHAIDATNGRRLWRSRIKMEELSGGVGIGGGLVFVGDKNGGLYAYHQSDGAFAWRKQLAAQILAPPTADNELVIVRTDDALIYALSVDDGSEVWRYIGGLPSLTLQGNGPPLIADNIVLAGLDNGRLVALNLKNGDEIWRLRFARSEGDSIIERLVDIDGDLLVDGDALYVTSYQGVLGAVLWRSGDLGWQVPDSSFWGLAAGLGNLYLVDPESVIKAYLQRDGELNWQQDILIRRQLSAPETIRNFIVVGDNKGYIHFLKQLDGNLVGRIRHNKAGVTARILVDGNTLYCLGNDGNISAYRTNIL